MVIIFLIAGIGQAHGANSSVHCLAVVNTTPRIKSYSHCVNHKL